MSMNNYGKLFFGHNFERFGNRSASIKRSTSFKKDEEPRDNEEFFRIRSEAENPFRSFLITNKILRMPCQDCNIKNIRIKILASITKHYLKNSILL